VVAEDHTEEVGPRFTEVAADLEEVGPRFTGAEVEEQQSSLLHL
jgi:hypothetical protein